MNEQLATIIANDAAEHGDMSTIDMVIAARIVAERERNNPDLTDYQRGCQAYVVQALKNLTLYMKSNMT
jgi:hypothetical protein